jgi:two-component system OmpR family sensor kinase
MAALREAATTMSTLWLIASGNCRSLLRRFDAPAVLAGIVTFALIDVAAGLAPRGSAALLLTLLAAMVAACGGLLAELAARLSDTPLFSWVSLCLWVYGLVVLPATAELAAPAGAADAAVVQLAALLIGAAALAVGLRPIRTRGGPTTWIAAAAAAILLLLTDLASRAAPEAALLIATHPAADLLLLLIWSAAALSYIVAGVRRRARGVTWVGAGIGVVVLAHADRTLVPPDALTVFPVLRLAGLVIVTAGLFGLARSAKRAGETRRRELELELESATETRRRLLVGAAQRDHELRNGLSGLSGITEFLRTPPPSGERERLRSAVESELDRLEAILAGGSAAADQFSLEALVTDVVTLRRPAAGPISVEVAPDLWVSGSRTITGQALSNLLGNCARHAPGAPVRISAWRRGCRVRLRVVDEGPGVSLEIRDRILEPGVRSADTGGSGLGLAISQQLLAADRAQITVEHRPPGAGCAVLVELAAADIPAGHRSGLA